MPEERSFDTQFYIKVDGTYLSTSEMDTLFEIEVDVGFFMPGTATLKFYDQELEWLDSSKLKLGAEVEISAEDSTQASARIFKGILTTLEPEYVTGGPYSMFVARCYDKSFNMHRGTKSKVYVQMSDSDIVNAVVGESGLSADVDATTFVHDTLIRHDQSDFEFLIALARRNGYALIFDGDKVQFKKAETISNGEVTCEYGVDLIEFRPRYSLGGQVNEVRVHGWDLVAKQEVVGVAKTPVFKPAETKLDRGAIEATRAFNSQSLHVTASPKSQAFAEGLAKSVAERMAASDLTAEGVVLGNVGIKPGGKLDLKNLGRFSGKYFVRRALHHFGQAEPYTTQVWLGGLESGTFASLIRDDPRTSPSSTGRQSGLIRAIVTDINDAEGYARVKVKLPTMGDDIQTFWASVVSAGAGPERGFYVIPEVNDEVLVGFIDGDVNYPVVLGGLWNGADAPPQGSSAVSSGTVDIREFKTRVGHVLRFTDKSGDEKIELIDKTGSNLIKIVSGENTISINAAKDIVLEAQGDIVLKAVNIKLEGSAKVEVGAPVVEAAGDSQINLKAPMATLAGSGMTKITGGMVQIN